MLSGLDLDPIRGLLALAQGCKDNFDTEDGLGWLLYNFNDSYPSRVSTYDGVIREGAFTQAKLRVSCWNEYATGGMQLDFIELVVHCFKNGDCNIHGIPSIANPRVIITTKAAELVGVVPRGGALPLDEPGKILEPDAIYQRWKKGEGVARNRKNPKSN